MMNLMQSISGSAWVAGFKTVPCTDSKCTRWLTQRHLSSRSVGVRMLDKWYCSYSCFATAAAERFSQLLTSRPPQVNRLSRMPLALILLSRGLLTHVQLKQVTDEQKLTGEEIGEIFMRLGFVSEKDVTAARATQWGCPVFSVPSRLLGPRIHIPSTLMRLHSMTPLHHVASTNSLLVGFVNGVEYGPLYAIEQITGCKTQACFITPTEFEAQMQQYNQAGAPPEELTFEQAQSPVKMTRVLCDYGVLLNADQAVLARAGNTLWARLKSSSRTTDILFNAG